VAIPTNSQIQFGHIRSVPVADPGGGARHPPNVVVDISYCHIKYNIFRRGWTAFHFFFFWRGGFYTLLFLYQYFYIILISTDLLELYPSVDFRLNLRSFPQPTYGV
jgi:hypothetical protein